MGAAPCSIGESGSWRLSLRARRVRRPHREAAEGTELFRVRFRAQFALRSPFPSRSTRAATKEVRVRPRNLDAFGALLLAPPYRGRSVRYIAISEFSSFQPITPFSSTSGRKSQNVTPEQTSSLEAITVAVRLPASIRAISPK